MNATGGFFIDPFVSKYPKILLHVQFIFKGSLF